MTLKEITLLSKKEYKNYRPIIPVIDDWWWLRSPGYDQDRTAIVDYNGGIDSDGYLVNTGCNAVRPALRLELETFDSLFWYKPELLVGTKIEYGKYQWTILDASLGELYILCDDIIARRRFDPSSNNWDTSELKQWLETDVTRVISSEDFV